MPSADGARAEPSMTRPRTCGSGSALVSSHRRASNSRRISVTKLQSESRKSWACSLVVPTSTATTPYFARAWSYGAGGRRSRRARPSPRRRARARGDLPLLLRSMLLNCGSPVPAPNTPATPLRPVTRWRRTAQTTHNSPRPTPPRPLRSERDQVSAPTSTRGARRPAAMPRTGRGFARHGRRRCSARSRRRPGGAHSLGPRSWTRLAASQPLASLATSLAAT